MAAAIKINEKDNVAVALKALKKGEREQGVVLNEDIAAGQWVHTHNLKTKLSEKAEYSYSGALAHIKKEPAGTFAGFNRKDGKAGVRNEVWILPLVGCVNGIAEKLARMNDEAAKQNGLYGVLAFTHPYGCSQMGEDHETTKKLLAALAKHPNAGSVLVVGLGCENLTMQQFKEALGEYDEQRIKFMICQDVEDEIAEGEALLKQLIEYAAGFKREDIRLEKLVVGLKCGGSDGLSGITANPAVGRFCDMLTARGASAILTEVPEMFGAEQVLMSRAVNKQVFDKAVNMVESFKEYFTAHGQTVYENPSPGNKDGGISTLEDKSLGCVQKGGTAPVADVIAYGEELKTTGLSLLWGPGNDLVSTTALSAAGAQIILFTTGRGTPFGAPVPTIKIATNTALFKHKQKWLDFNAGTVAEGESLDEAAKRLFDLVMQTAEGKIKTKTEQQGYREIAIFKDGVVL